MPTKLTQSFFTRDTLTVAKQLLGKLLVIDSPNEQLIVKINEVEAYIGQSDPACHAAASPKTNGLTPRTAPMFLAGGHLYVYFTYGMYHCLNIVTESAGFPSAVLIRSAIPIKGKEQMQHRRSTNQLSNLINGPGKLCQALNLNKSHNGMDITNPNSPIYILDQPPVINFKTSPRIGISKGKQQPWRFFFLTNQPKNLYK